MTARTVEQIMADRRAISPKGRMAVTEALNRENRGHGWNWGLPYASEDLLTEALSGLSELDLEAVRLFAQHLDSAATCRLLRDFPMRPAKPLWDDDAAEALRRDREAEWVAALTADDPLGAIGGEQR